MTDANVVVIAGGVGAARFLRGLVEVHDPAKVTAIVNVADDFVVHGLYICPDLDTVRSTLVDDVGPQGWGRANETWTVMNELRVVSSNAPEASRATDWFSLGDRDLAIHMYRTQRMREGAPLSEVTLELAEETGVRSRLLPVSNDVVQTRLTLTTGQEVDFQEYFVALRHSVSVNSVSFAGIESAKPGPGVIDAIENADQIIIAPSNPFVSIAPVLEVAGVRAAIRARREDVVAISPIIGGKAVKGPADRMLDELGFVSSVTAIAQLWSDVAGTLLVDSTDADLVDDVENAGMHAVVCNTLMSDIDHSTQLARDVLSVRSPR